MNDEQEQLAQAKERLRCKIEEVFVEIEPNSERRLKLASIIAKHSDSASFEAFRAVLTRIATTPTEREVAQGIDKDARNILQNVYQSE